MPVAIFEWTIHNLGLAGSPLPLDVTISFSFQNGVARGTDKHGGHVNILFTQPCRDIEAAAGVVLAHNDPLPLSLAVAAARVVRGTPVEVTSLARFDVRGDGRTAWRHSAGLAQPQKEKKARPAKGVVTDPAEQAWRDVPDETPSRKGEAIGAVVSARVSVASPSPKSPSDPASIRHVAFALAWDVPVVAFPHGNPREPLFRRYARFYGGDGRAGPALAAEALAVYPRWVAAIDAWQKPVLTDARLPAWFFSFFSFVFFLKKM
jgi:hypothetical protein